MNKLVNKDIKQGNLSYYGKWILHSLSACNEKYKKGTL